MNNCLVWTAAYAVSHECEAFLKFPLFSLRLTIAIDFLQALYIWSARHLPSSVYQVVPKAEQIFIASQDRQRAGGGTLVKSVYH